MMKDLSALEAQFVDIKKNCILLCPRETDEKVSKTQSKLGGHGLLDALAPQCPKCRSTTAFVLQLFQTEFPLLYFPPGYDVLAMYKCVKNDCSGVYDDSMGMFNLLQYHKAVDEVVCLESSENKAGGSITSCILNPVLIKDYPSYEEDEYPDLQPVLGIDEDELDELMTDHFAPRRGTKIGGYPSFIQSPWYPECPNCKQPTEFIFQLASGEAIDADTENEYPHWSDHGIMIGDLGNLYAYVCKRCVSTRVFTYWDCY